VVDVVVMVGNNVGTASAIRGDSGSNLCFSLIEKTIFSRPNEVICFSLPLPLPSTQARDAWGTISTGADRGGCVAGTDPATSDVTESTLAESSGISLRSGQDRVMSIAGVVVNCGWDSQQSVSRFQIRQLRFSNRRPFSIDSAHLEKTDESRRPHQNQKRSGWSECRDYSPLHMPNRFSTFLVSTLCILPASTDSIGVSSRIGMVELI
jgi:hypothetical protein